MGLGLRAKSALALFASILVVLALALLAGGRALRAVEDNLGTGYARNLTQYNKQRILAPVARELALSQQLADSIVTREFLLDENDPEKRRRFFAETERYRNSFEDKSYFVISARTRHYFFNDRHSKWSDKPRYLLNPKDKTDRWFFSSLEKTKDFNINVDPDVKLKLTKVWFNVVVPDGTRKLGLAGTGLELTSFLDRFIKSAEPGVTPIILNQQGAIQAHPDRKLIDYSSVDDKGAAHSTVFRLLPRASDDAAVRKAMAAAVLDPESMQNLWVQLGGKQQLFALSYVPELSWFVVTAVDLNAARVIDSSLWIPPLLIGLALLGVLLMAITLGVDRILLRPVLKLTDSARTIAAGRYDVELPPAGQDELGELSRAFSHMAAQVRSHTDELETRVQERTQELVAVNQQMAAAHKQIGDSIQYASLIQGAILPNRELAQRLGEKFFVLWRPRDVVGGDFYVFREDEDGCLLGVVDCAGHGVPGAIMTMIAYAVINVALDNKGLKDPAAVLIEADGRLRTMLRTDPQYSQVATNMDAGLAYVDYAARTVTFAGAKISLYWSDGEEVGEIKGDRSAIGAKRLPELTNRQAPLSSETTFYLTTDGLLDQSGGPKGFSYGNQRFTELLKRQAQRPFAQQQHAFSEEIENFQGELPQRDDITVLSFRFS